MQPSVCLTGIRQVACLPVDEPSPQPGDALVRVLQVGICGSDLHLFRDGAIGEAKASLPFVLGHEAMGVVEEVVSPEHSHLLGKRVAIEPAIPCLRCEFCLRGDLNLCPNHLFLGLPPKSGAMQEHIAHPAHLLEPVPDSLSDAEAVLLEPLAIALHAVDLGKVRTGASAAILGCGTIGLCVLMVLKQLGMYPLFCTDLLEYRLKLAQELGADETVNAARMDVVAEARRFTSGRGFDYVFECAGVDDTQWQTAQIASPGAKCLIVGTNPAGHVRLEGSAARRKGLSILMVRRSRLTLKRAMTLVVQGRIPLARLATHVFPTTQCQRAFDTAVEYRDGVVKAFVRLE
ncbi:MAG: alcohol dehydrogenase catalytic domain-containing protein [Armatimonadota bacterium]|nr:alcohol dehydrogenase catalytic domain-containing protein [bacterium]MDW8321162.1 alcohol dehydrogenase catalytic domain-containing protein [Armatimonadota bacterium]